LNDNEITVTVQTGRGSKTETFPKQTKVEDVIAWAIQQFGLSPSEPYELVRQNGGVPLEPQRPLVSYHIEDGEILIVSAAGTGV